uniref:EOG090X020Z n=1 Tax=Evadne anonyx TaxID=141404 RepID=A0A9N6WPQ5_9CRUS|nr:EOG090X020Z [Evadne anonyx]
MESEDSNVSNQIEVGDVVDSNQESPQNVEKTSEPTEPTEINELNNKICEPMDTGDTEVEPEDNPEEHEDEELGEKKLKNSGGFTGRGVTLQMLLEDNILQPKEGAMSLEYMGQKFEGDLLNDGRIRSAEVQEVFGSPSAWALRCKKIVNPEQKYGCGWSSVRYCGRPLDVYKNQWMRKRRLEQISESSPTPDCNAPINDNNEAEMDARQVTKSPAVFKIGFCDRPTFKHETLGNRSTLDDGNLLVETLIFNNFGKLQPFTVSLHTSAAIVIDIHCSLTSSEVVGYLAGIWDMNTNGLTIKRAFPCLSRLADASRGHTMELTIFQAMEAAGLSLVGWYHSHPSAPPTPTVQDIDTQLEYQLKLKGGGDQGYRPCIAMISSPYQRGSDVSEYTELNETSGGSPGCPLTCYWVSPPPESRPQELARPMAMKYTVVPDSYIDQAVYHDIESCLQFYKDAIDRINVSEIWKESVTILDKLKAALITNLKNDQSSTSIRSFLCNKNGNM